VETGFLLTLSNDKPSCERIGPAIDV